MRLWLMRAGMRCQRRRGSKNYIGRGIRSTTGYWQCEPDKRTDPSEVSIEVPRGNHDGPLVLLLVNAVNLVTLHRTGTRTEDSPAAVT